MSVAVLSADAVTARMLELEAKRCGFYKESADKAHVLLIDLDHPVKSIARADASLVIAFCEEPARLDETVRARYNAVLALPFCVEELSALLRERSSAITLSGDADRLLPSKKLHFSQVEQALLDHLRAHRDRTVTAQELSTIIGQSAENSNAVAVYLYRLRRKLEADGQRRIRTVRGVGYRWLGD